MIYTRIGYVINRYTCVCTHVRRLILFTCVYVYFSLSLCVCTHTEMDKVRKREQSK